MVLAKYSAVGNYGRDLMWWGIDTTWAPARRSMRLSSLAGAEEPASWLAAETWLVCMSAAVEEAAAAGFEAALLFAPAPLFFPPAVALYQHNITEHKNRFGYIVLTLLNYVSVYRT